MVLIGAYVFNTTSALKYADCEAPLNIHRIVSDARGLREHPKRFAVGNECRTRRSRGRAGQQACRGPRALALRGRDTQTEAIGPLRP
jgi:hypothetical protein